ncbi:hypothetical protein [Oceanibacterium hippocampi]|uniref:Uncharacterized protein n=1 Tax=Oceanibacterium hippocampi TaxID=745714 RepID=A0A1Y5T4H3_9PROT|nr:hypothetical protein [Oceanibacterium hippocampi]SLN55599.1 hypothetical protein OCH7691_02383 [Oceanibacterium hippocampi]
MEQVRDKADRVIPDDREGDRLAGPHLVDAHVHCYPCFGEVRLFDAARDNFSAVGGRAVDGGVLGWLLYTETARDHHFRACRDRADGPAQAGDWRFETTGEAISLRAVSADGATLGLVAGRQIVTSEGLEVHALGTDREFPDRKPARETLIAVRESGALPVIPWGFGKWWFARGRLLRQLLDERGALGAFLLGDNGGRPDLLGTPEGFRIAGRSTIPVLPGSDPLPLEGEERRTASYGFRLEGAIDRSLPGAGLLGLMRGLDGSPPTIGRRAGTLEFLISQSRMRLPH